ncbi:MAG: hypothetical protein JJV95_01110 [Sulfurospirillum sp.]|nr:hypothetical protein [Sulfurospirillum sp.]
MVNHAVALKINNEMIKIDNILSVTFNDVAGSKSDRVTVKVVPTFKRPKPSTKLELIFVRLNNNKVVESLECGLFHIQTITRANNQDLSFTATGVEFNDKQKNKLSHHYKDAKLSNIVDIVADRLGHKVKFKTVNPMITSLNQTEETDINFLERLANDYNVLFSIKNDIIYFINKNDDSLPTFTVEAPLCKSISIKHSSKTYYKSALSSYWDIRDGEFKNVTVGKGSPVLKIKYNSKTYQDEADIKIKAQAKLDQSSKGLVQGSFSTSGMKIYAGTRANLLNTFNNEDDGIYSCESCTHTWSRGGGWVSSVEIEN